VAFSRLVSQLTDHPVFRPKDRQRGALGFFLLTRADLFFHSGLTDYGTRDVPKMNANYSSTLHSERPNEHR